MMTKSLNTPVRSILSGLAAAALLLPFTGCEVKKTQDAKAPDVDVNVEGGQPPKYDVDAADVNVKTEEKEVTVPKITTEKENVTVPDVDVNMPGETPTPNP
ncbi:MAG: hypothetical protein M3Q86_14245 [Verrucomicrobiota bacterium]|nr:hypothetical protein [Verrucomicrobiota bacterium]